MGHFVLLLHAGDYLDASRRRGAGQGDRYRHHSYALESLERLQDAGTRVSVIQMHSPHAYDEGGPDQIRFIGLGRGTAAEVAVKVGKFLDIENASHVMLRSPSLEVLDEVTRRPVKVGVVLADSFPSPLRNQRRYRQLGRALDHPSVDFVANHHRNSSRQLVDILGVGRAKVIPWDWPLDLLEVAASAPRRHPGDAVRLCYVGSINKMKGVWDAVEAVRRLRRRGLDARLDVAGAGEVDHLVAVVDRYGLRDSVTYHGRVGGDAVIDLMQASSFVCVPSRHAYPEGLPLTIYEAMASGTPIIASDHPMFHGVVVDGETGFQFRAGSSRSLARAVAHAWADRAAYERVSRTAAERYRTLGLNTLWGDLAVRWVRGLPEDEEWIQGRALTG